MLAILTQTMSSHLSGQAPQDTDELSSLQAELVNCWTDAGPNFELITERIAEAMLSARKECLLILNLFNGNEEILASFIEAARAMKLLKPATIPTLLKQQGKLSDQDLAEQMVVDVLQPTAN